MDSNCISLLAKKSSLFPAGRKLTLLLQLCMFLFSVPKLIKTEIRFALPGAACFLIH